MAQALETLALAPQLRSLVTRALRDPLECEDAIDALEQALARRRSPPILIALAAVLHREAEALVLSRIEEASTRALALIDEALALGACESSHVVALKARCLRSLERERAREATLLERAVNGATPAAALCELAHRMLAHGSDDALALEILRRVEDRDRDRDHALDALAS